MGEVRGSLSRQRGSSYRDLGEASIGIVGEGYNIRANKTYKGFIFDIITVFDILKGNQ
jgi:hypothetical protein